MSTLDNYLLIGSTDKTCKIFEFNKDTKSYKQIAHLHHSNEYIYATHIAKINGKYSFMFAGKDKNIYIVDSKGDIIKKLEGAHNGPICSLCSNDKYLISGSWDATAKIWDIKTLEFVKTIEDSEFAHAVTACILSNGIIVASS